MFGHCTVNWESKSNMQYLCLLRTFYTVLELQSHAPFKQVHSNHSSLSLRTSKQDKICILLIIVVSRDSGLVLELA